MATALAYLALALLRDTGIGRVQGHAIAAPMPPALLSGWAGSALAWA